MLGDGGLAEAAAPLEQHVLAAVDEVELDEALDESAVDLLGVVPVEAVERLEGAEAGEAGPAREVDGGAAALLEIGELFEGLGGPEATLVDVGEERGERVLADVGTMLWLTIPSTQPTPQSRPPLI